MIFELIGTLVLLFHIFKLLKCLHQYFFIHKSDLLEKFGRNSWVLVTGCTGGLGEEFCKQFAEAGFSIYLQG